MKPLCTKMSKRGTKELLKAVSHERDDRLSALCYCDAYLLSDGRVVLVSQHGSGDVWPNVATLNGVLQKKTGKDQGFWQRVLPSGERFPDTVESSARELSRLFRVNPDELDFTPSSTRVIERVIGDAGHSCLMHPYFEPLVAYMGEVLRRKKRGRWEMRQMEDGTTWRPWIVYTSDEVAPFILVYEKLSEGEPISDISAL